jgi:hypothetical protein
MNIFEILAECSIALAGFGAVHAALQGSTGPRGAMRAWVVVAQGGCAFVLSLLPLLFDLGSMSQEQLWRVTSIFGVAGTSAAAYSTVVIDIQLTRRGHPPQAPWNIRFAQLSTVIAVFAMLINLIGWPWNPQAFPYATAIILVLITGLLALLHSFLMPVQAALRSEDPGQSNEPPAA